MCVCVNVRVCACHWSPETGTYCRTIFGPHSFSIVSPSSLPFSEVRLRHRHKSAGGSDRTEGPDRIGRHHRADSWPSHEAAQGCQSEFRGFPDWLISALCLSHSSRSGNLLPFPNQGWGELTVFAKGYYFFICSLRDCIHAGPLPAVYAWCGDWIHNWQVKVWKPK